MTPKCSALYRRCLEVTEGIWGRQQQVFDSCPWGRRSTFRLRRVACEPFWCCCNTQKWYRNRYLSETKAEIYQVKRGTSFPRHLPQVVKKHWFEPNHGVYDRYRSVTIPVMSRAWDLYPSSGFISLSQNLRLEKNNKILKKSTSGRILSNPPYFKIWD